MTALSETKRYQAYPEYKDSRIDWLDVVPSNWNMSKVKYLAPFQVGWTPSTRNDDNFIGENLWVNISDLKTRTIVDTVKRISDKAAKEASMDITPQGSLMYSFKLSVGAVSFAGKDMYTNEAIASFLATAQLPLNYLYYALPKFIIENASTNIYGAKILNQELINNAILLAPSFAEAENIANFLDHETAKIDSLIEKQQQLIKLLKEKRQAVISHAVTKGLNPDAPMKDSGVEWLREVPEHWEILRIAHLFKESSLRANTPEERQLPILSVSIHHGISDKELNEEELDRKVTRSEDKSLYKIIADNDLAYNMMRAWQGAFGATKIAGLISPAYVVCKPRTQMNSKYFELLLRTSNAVTELKRYSRGITDFRLRLYWDELKNIIVPVPPSQEADQIIEMINTINEKFINLESAANNQIELLKERRTALISAAVTGKIDVRDWLPPHQQDEESI